MDNLQAELAQLKREILELKTAQIIPGNSTMHTATAHASAGNYDGVYAWTIYYEDVGSTQAPITMTNPGEGFSLLKYDSGTNTQKVEWYISNGYDWPAFDFPIYSSRPISSVGNITRTGSTDDYVPPPAQLWEQVRTFKLSQMGTTPGWCLKNCCLGFGITGGGFPTARADMESQSNNGTLHGAKSTPPNYIQVPVYIDTGTTEGHVVVWDKGTVYSDGVKIDQGLSYYGMNNIWGWGELCGGYRVVQHT